MLKRESKFPASRRTRSRNTGYQAPERRRRNRVLPVLFILSLAAGLYIYEMPGRPWAKYTEQLRRILSDREAVETQTVPDAPPVIKLAPRPQVRNKGRTDTSRRKEDIMARSGPITPSPKQVAPKSVQLDISIGMGFRPVGFRIGAVSRSIALSTQPDRRMHRLPRFTAPKQRYGVIKLAHGREYGFVLDLAASGYRMYLDLNRNGNLRDDGKPLLNQGKGLFATKLILPLDHVSGIPRLKGDYRLWLFTNPTSWKRGRLLFYSMTQLQGQLQLNGRHYTAYLSDNGPVDGDYRNDGISIDLNGDGKIDRRSELISHGKSVLIDGERYSFRITR